MRVPVDLFPNEVDARVREGVRLIDVREPDEYAGGHIPGAENIPLGELPQRLPDPSERVIVVCASGGRSARAAQLLTDLGVRDVSNVLGGTLAYAREGRFLAFPEDAPSTGRP